MNTLEILGSTDINKLVIFFAGSYGEASFTTVEAFCDDHKRSLSDEEVDFIFDRADGFFDKDYAPTFDGCGACGEFVFTKRMSTDKWNGQLRVEYLSEDDCVTEISQEDIDEFLNSEPEPGLLACKTASYAINTRSMVR